MESTSYLDAYSADISDVSKVSVEKVIMAVKAIPQAIESSVDSCREVNCALFKASRSAKGIKYLPHGHMRTPLLLGNVQPTPAYIERLCEHSTLLHSEVEQISKAIVLKAKIALGQGDGSFYIIPNVCRIYVDNGRIRVTTNPKSMDVRYGH